jgi:hypothetical protein
LDTIKAVVSRGGRPDLALSYSASSNSTHFITSGMDVPVIGMNKMAFDELHSVKMKIVPGATHLLKNRKVTRSHNLAITWYKDIWSLKKCHPDLKIFK